MYSEICGSAKSRSSRAKGLGNAQPGNNKVVELLWLWAPVFAIQQQTIVLRLHHPIEVRGKQLKQLIGEQRSYRTFILPPQKILTRKARVGLKVDVFTGKPCAMLSPRVSGCKVKSGRFRSSDSSSITVYHSSWLLRSL